MKCPVCDKEFQWRSNKKYCSRKCKERAHARRHYKLNRDREIVKSKKYYEGHREERLEYQKQWRENNPEKAKKYYAPKGRKSPLTPEEKRERRREYRRKNLYKIRDRQMEYRIKNLERIRERERLRSQYMVYFRGKRIKLNYKPRKGACELCGNIGKTKIFYECYGETFEESEYIELCYSCYFKKMPHGASGVMGRFIPECYRDEKPTIKIPKSLIEKAVAKQIIEFERQDIS